MKKHDKEEILGPALRPEYIATAERIHKQPSIKIGTMAHLRKKYKKYEQKLIERFINPIFYSRILKTKT